jgi:hypothetical protein
MTSKWKFTLKKSQILNKKTMLINLIFIDLVQSMPTRLAEVAGAQGGHTRY